MTSEGAITDDRMESLYRKVRHGFWMLAQPVDFGALERDGAIVRIGNWYRVRRADDLPKSVWFGAEKKVVNGEMLIRFDINTEYYQRLAKRAGVDWRGPEPRC